MTLGRTAAWAAMALLALHVTAERSTTAQSSGARQAKTKPQAKTQTTGSTAPSPQKAQPGGEFGSVMGTAEAPKVDAIFADVAKPDSPGCALGVIRDGKLIYAKGYGQAVIEHSVPIAPRTVFDIGSVSKHITAAAIVLLAQQGRLSLDDEVRKYVPELPDYTEASGGRKLTIRHLLHHTGGVRNYDTLMALAAVDFTSTTGDAEALDYIARQKELNFAPGEDYLYSNSGYFLLSLIVKKASGKTLKEFAEENIFRPLGMNDTQYLDDTQRIVMRRAASYSPKREGGWEIEMSNFEQTGDGAVQTTVEDFLLWDQNFYSGKVMGAEGLKWMQTPGVLNNGKKLTYAFGLVVEKYKGLNVVQHGGSWAGYRAHYARYPDQRFSVVTLCNASNANPGRRSNLVAEIFLGREMASAPAAAGPAPEKVAEATPEQLAKWKEYAGIYRSEKLGSVLRIVLDGKEKKLRLRPGGQSFDLAPAGPDEFQMLPREAGLRVKFESAGAGKFRMVRTDSDGTTTPYESMDAFTPSAEQQREFLGSFYSDEADVAYTIFEKESKLHLRIGKWTEMPIEPLYRDAFSFRFGQLLFQRDAAGRIGSFHVQAGRVRNIRFVRK